MLETPHGRQIGSGHEGVAVSDRYMRAVVVGGQNNEDLREAKGQKGEREMGMFDELRIEGMGLPGLPEEAIRRAQDGPDEEGVAGERYAFQTKSLENGLNHYVLRDGRLLQRRYEREAVPEAQRPYYGKPEWNGRKAKDDGTEVNARFPNHYYRQLGASRIVGYKELDTLFHGDIVFYAAAGDLGIEEGGLVEFEARFAEGLLTRIEPYDEGQAAQEHRERWREAKFVSLP